MPSTVAYNVGDAHAERLIQIYKAAQKKLEAHVAQTLSSGAIGSHAYYERQLKMAQLMLSQLQLDKTSQVYSGIAEIYKASGHAAFNVGNMGGQFGGINQRAVALLAHSMNTKIDDALVMIGRRIEDAFRDAALKETAAGVAGGLTRKQVSAALEKRLIEKGITDSVTGFVDKAGRRWSLESYTRMVSRTTTREAMTGAVVDQIQRADSGDLISISSHPSEADVCTPYAGKTWSLGGKTKGYPVIDRLPPFHPNCKHVASPAAATFEEFEAELDKQLKNPTPDPTPAGAPTIPKATNPSKAAKKAAQELELKGKDKALWDSSKLVDTPHATYGTADGSQVFTSKAQAEDVFAGQPLYEHRLPNSARLVEMESANLPTYNGVPLTPDEIVKAARRSGYDGISLILPDGSQTIKVFRKVKVTPNKSGKAIRYHEFTSGRPKAVNPSPDVQNLKLNPKPKAKPKSKVVKGQAPPKMAEPPKVTPKPPDPPKKPLAKPSKTKAITGEALDRATRDAQRLLAAICKPGTGTFNAFRSYCGSGYSRINVVLRRLARGESRSAINDPHTLDEIANLDKLFSSEHARHDYRATLWRSVGKRTGGHYIESVKNLKVGDVHIEDGYASTSSRRSMAENWSMSKEAPDLWEIDGPPGWNGVNVNAHSLSPHSGEDEILLPRGVKLKIIAMDNVTIGGKRWRHIRARIIVG